VLFLFLQEQKMETLTINGKPRSFPAGHLPESLTDLLDLLEVNAATVVAEIDGAIIAREKFENTNLTAGQSIELVRFVQGG
jgi:sulfur carrier protein